MKIFRELCTCNDTLIFNKLSFHILAEYKVKQEN